MPITAEKSTLKVLVAQLLLCQRLVIHLFLGYKPRLHSTLPHTSYKDIVSFCGAAQSWVLQKMLSHLPSVWSIVLCVLRKKSHRNYESIQADLIGDFFCVVAITKPCQIAFVCLTHYCFQYCLHSSTHKQHDLVYHSRFTCSRHWWSFHCELHTPIFHLQLVD